MHSRNNNKPWEFGANATVGLLREYNKFYIRPAVVVPIYQSLKGDKAFHEDRHMTIRKWLNGGGLAVRVGRYI
jgi:hypothetical protein